MLLKTASFFCCILRTHVRFSPNTEKGVNRMATLNDALKEDIKILKKYRNLLMTRKDVGNV